MLMLIVFHPLTNRFLLFQVTSVTCVGWILINLVVIAVFDSVGNKVFKNKAPPQAIDLLSKWLCYKPKDRLPALESLAHPFFGNTNK